MNSAGSPIKLLLAEDSELDAELIIAELKKSGLNFDFKRVDNAAAFSSALQSEEWDIVLSDYSMPQFTGIEALRILRELNTETPLIIVTGSIDEETAVNCLKIGAENYILKENMTRLVPAVNNALKILEDRRTRRLLESENAKLQQQLLQSQKMETVGTLAAGVAHDFNNFLTAILGYADLINMTAGNNSRINELATGIIEASKQATGVTRALLTFSRKAESIKETTSLGKFLETTVSLVRQLLPSSVKLIEKNISQEIFVNIDSAQMQQVFMNLAVNARDAMPEGGELTIELAKQPITKYPILNKTNSNLKEVAVVTISDTGVGIPEEIKARIFDPFFTTKPVGSGTGLGLSIVHGIISNHGGLLDVSSKEGVGTSFSVILPLLQDESIKDVRNSEHTDIRGSGESVLLIEDNPQILALLTISLKNMGYKVISANSVEVGIKLFQQHHADLLFVIIDVAVQQKIGLHCLSQIREIKEGIPAIFMGDYEERQYHFVEQPHTAFLTKPFKLDKLRSAIAEVTK